MSWHFKNKKSISPADAGWTYCGMRIHDFGVEKTLSTYFADEEVVVVPLSAENITVTVDKAEYVLKGRSSVFDAVSDWLYIPVGSKVSLSASAGEVALCTAKASVRGEVFYRPAIDVSIEIRGSGRASRQVNNIATPSSFMGATKINVCEVLTPGGNWSSWPPHKHDGKDGCPYTNEEIYYFKIQGQGGEGLFHCYTSDGSVDETSTIKDGDFYIVPQGFHGPTAAAPDYAMYFLNVLAGPNQDRTMSFCDDPAHAWIRQSWQSQEIDKRLPMTGAK